MILSRMDFVFSRGGYRYFLKFSRMGFVFSRVKNEEFQLKGYSYITFYCDRGRNREVFIATIVLTKNFVHIFNVHSLLFSRL